MDNIMRFVFVGQKELFPLVVLFVAAAADVADDVWWNLVDWCWGKLIEFVVEMWWCMKINFKRVPNVHVRRIHCREVVDELMEVILVNNPLKVVTGQLLR